MKYSIKLLIFAIGVILISCTNEESPSPDNSIVGTWEMSEMTYTGVSTATYQGMEFSSSFEGIATDINCSLELKDSPKTFVSQGSYTINLKSEIYEQISEYNVQIEGFMNSGPYELKDDKLIVTSLDGDTDAANIVTLTDSKMVLTYSETIEQSMEGVENSTTFDGIFIFIRK